MFGRFGLPGAMKLGSGGVRVGVPVRDFAQKLRLTSALLGCATQKDLCLLFRKVNPDTEFDLERSYNWIQGRSRPRSARVYEDWARLLATGRPAGFLTSCSMEEFFEVVARRFDLSTAELAHMAGYQAPEARPGGTARRPPAFIAGRYACYSHAWSPHFKGMVVRGSLAIEPDPTMEAPPPLIAVYSESVAVGRLKAHGPVEVTGRSISVALTEPEQQLQLLMTLFLPSPPASALAGVMSGAAFVDSLAQPAATRIVMVRVPEASASAIEQSDRYLDVAEEPLAADLAALGLSIGRAQAADLEALLHQFLWADPDLGGLVRAPANAYAKLTRALDGLILPLAGPAPLPSRPRLVGRPDRGV